MNYEASDYERHNYLVLGSEIFLLISFQCANVFVDGVFEVGNVLMKQVSQRGINIVLFFVSIRTILIVELPYCLIELYH